MIAMEAQISMRYSFIRFSSLAEPEDKTKQRLDSLHRCFNH